MSIKKYFWFVPNSITSLNVLSGSLAIVFAFEGNLVLSGILILLAAVFDFLDGMSARLLDAYSPMGKELDSLADGISFGLAPAVIAHILVRQQVLPTGGLSTAPFLILVQLFFPFIIAIFSSLRLAKFNIDERQTESFIGLATPANAMIWASLPFILATQSNTFTVQLIQNPWFINGLALIMSLLLVSELPMFSLKFKNLKLSDNKTRFVFLLFSLVFIFVFKFVSIPLIIIFYILMSLIEFLILKPTQKT